MMISQKVWVEIWKDPFLSNDQRRQGLQWIESWEMWHDMLFMDETIVALEHYARLSSSKRDHSVAKVAPKHPLKLHV